MEHAILTSDCTHRHFKGLSPSYKIPLSEKENVRADFVRSKLKTRPYRTGMPGQA